MASMFLESDEVTEYVQYSEDGSNIEDVLNFLKKDGRKADILRTIPEVPDHVRRYAPTREGYDIEVSAGWYVNRHKNGVVSLSLNAPKLFF